MKKIAIILIIMGLSQVAPAQNKFKELIARIALLKVYLGYLQKGYSTVKGGLTFIGDIKAGEFKMHKDYFNSFKSINPKVKRYAKIADIISFQIEIIHRYKKAFGQAKDCGFFNPAELEYIHSVYSNLVKETAKDVILLIAVTTDGQLQMTDEQRLQQVERVYNHVQDQYSFIHAFSNELKMHSLQRLKELQGINGVQELYNIK